VGPRLTDFPFRCQTDPTEFPPNALEGLRQAYVRHNDPPLASLEKSYDRAQAAGWAMHDIASGHDMMVAAPRVTSELLLAIAAG
jgi:hypothetical protein